MTVVVEYRKPVAFVVTDSDRYPVDSKATLLPPPSLAAGSDELPTIRNAHSTPQGPAGTNWGDRIVEGAPAWPRCSARRGKNSSSPRFKFPTRSAPRGARTRRFTSCGRSAAPTSIWGRARQRPPGRADVPAKDRPARGLRRPQRRFQRRARPLRNRHPPLARNQPPTAVTASRPNAAVTKQRFATLGRRVRRKVEDPPVADNVPAPSTFKTRPPRVPPPPHNPPLHEPDKNRAAFIHPSPSPSSFILSTPLSLC